MIHVVRASDRTALARLYRSGWDPPAEVVDGVRAILADVRSRGDVALEEYTRRFDDPSADVGKLRVAIPMLEQARRLVPPEIAAAIELGRERVASFHRRQLSEDISYSESDGTAYTFARVPLGAIAAYVPGGSAPLPSSVVMTTVPAKIAGVARTIVLTPPQRDGGVHPSVLFACSLCGVDELYAVGGAQAIAAAAYGTKSIGPVDKIVGPGNVWVTEAKRQVFGTCAIDGLAGPSEVLVVADDDASSEYIVGELLAQAEHDPLARVAVVSESLALLEACAQLLDTLDVATLPRGAIVAAVIERGCWLIHAASREETIEVIDRFAPEHLSLQVRDPENYLPHVRRAGAIFANADTPVACGDYLAGTNHVLPTSGAARFSSGLSTADFLRSYTVVANSQTRMQADATALAAFAEFEGLSQHAQTARMRVR
ncbi:MAG: histidinol dehydrogenase [Candidatus Eremiobacteraeota bacterium]|nr:histidinol dehydrogenase [Candidatus Eremiobacteraeota bacterium]